MNQRGRWAAGILRIGIGAILVASAVGKALDLSGFARILGEYRAFPEGSLLVIAVGVIVAEVLLGVWLFTGIRLAAAAWCSAVLHLAYAGWSAVSVLRGLKLPNCGCFGVFLARPLGWTTVAEDVVLLAASLTLLVLARRSS